jgi:hypothetical protein
MTKVALLLAETIPGPEAERLHGVSVVSDELGWGSFKLAFRAEGLRLMKVPSRMVARPLKEPDGSL